MNQEQSSIPIPIEQERMMLNEVDNFSEEIGDHVKVIKEFLDMDGVGTDEIRTKFWAIFCKHVMLANFSAKNREDEEIAMRGFHIMIDTYLNSLPSYRITVELNRDIANMKFLFQFMLSRSRGGLERKLGATQIRQFISTDDREKPKKGGLLSRILPFGR